MPLAKPKDRQGVKDGYPSNFQRKWVRGRIVWAADYSALRFEFGGLERLAPGGTWREFRNAERPYRFWPREVDELLEDLNGQARRAYYRRIARNARARIRSETRRDSASTQRSVRMARSREIPPQKREGERWKEVTTPA